MILCVSTQHCFSRTPDGAFWTGSGFAYPFWTRYLDEFSGVRVLARVSDCDTPPARAVRADGPGVTFASLPSYQGPWGFLRQWGNIRSTMRKAIGRRDAVLFRIPAPFPAMCLDFLARRGQPFGVEVLGDPIDLFAPGTYKTPILPAIRLLTWLELRMICRKAAAAAYVTNAALQHRYPTRGVAFACSDVSIDESELAACPRSFPRDAPPFRLLFIGSLHHFQKGPDVLLEAVRALRVGGLDVKLTLLGDGPERAGLERMARDLSIDKNIEFVGVFPERAMVMSFLKRAHLFVLPSRAEGLPKVLPEAMAAGLPCISTTVGGIPEILESDDLVPPADPNALAAAIRSCLTNPARWEAMSRRNLATAARFTSARLAAPHRDFLRTLHRLSAEAASGALQG